MLVTHWRLTSIYQTTVLIQLSAYIYIDLQWIVPWWILIFYLWKSHLVALLHIIFHVSVSLGHYCLFWKNIFLIPIIPIRLNSHILLISNIPLFLNPRIKEFLIALGFWNNWNLMHWPIVSDFWLIEVQYICFIRVLLPFLEVIW